MKVSELIKRVRFTIKDENYEDIKQDWIIIDVLNSAIAEILSQTKMIEDIVEIDLTDGVGILPDDFLILKNVFTQNGDVIYRATIDYFNRIDDSSIPVNRPFYVFLKPNKIMIKGYDGNKVKAHIYKTIKITDENQEVDLKPELIPVVVYKTAIELYISGRVSAMKIPPSLVEVWMLEVQSRIDSFKNIRIEEDQIKGFVKIKKDFFK